MMHPQETLGRGVPKALEATNLPMLVRLVTHIHITLSPTVCQEQSVQCGAFTLS